MLGNHAFLRVKFLRSCVEETATKLLANDAESESRGAAKQQAQIVHGGDGERKAERPQVKMATRWIAAADHHCT